MKKHLTISLLALVFFTLTACGKTEIRNMDSRFFTNPIFAGDYPDPSILVDGKDYYVVHSSFEYYPGLTIWHSRDLLHWTPVTSALHKYVGSVWAPDLAKYNGRYYIYFPAQNTNWVVTAAAIEGPWSDPLDLKIGGIDPGHVVDNAGQRYLYFSSGDYAPLAEEGLAIIGETKHSYDGWPIPREWTIECFCLEGPKLAKHGDYYYLTVAEGGTAGPATGHMVISARAKSPLGPWENSPFNPIARTRDSSEKWWSVGHGTIFADAYDQWWLIFHGYENGHYNMGRQTLLAPIEWTADGWYKIPDSIRIDQPIPRPQADKGTPKAFSLSDDFSGNSLRPHWKFFGEYDPDRFKVKNNSIIVNGKGQSVAECSPLLVMPADHSYNAQVEIEITGDAIGGLVLFYNPSAYSGILADSENVLANLRGWQFPTEKNVIDRHVFLRLKNTDNIVDMYYSVDDKNWTKIESSLEVSALHHNVLGGFMALRIALCAVGAGQVRFSDFKYEAIE